MENFIFCVELLPSEDWTMYLYIICKSYDNKHTSAIVAESYVRWNQ